MSKKTIGIKQADGSFYPILEDGEPANKTLELTTVMDGQTAVKVNLYKKHEDTDELEYVDTLLIENLVPHQKEEPSFSLSINLDDDNVLTAEVLDPETGAKSDTSVSLVTLSEAQLDDSMDFALADDPSNFDDIATSDLATGLTDDFNSLPDFDDEDVSISEDSLSLDENLDINSDDLDLSVLTSDTMEDSLDMDSGDFSFGEDVELNDDFGLNTESTEEKSDVETDDEFNMNTDDFSFGDEDGLSDDFTMTTETSEESSVTETSDDLDLSSFSNDELEESGDDFDLSSLSDETSSTAENGDEEFEFPENIKLQDDLTPSEDGLPDSLGDFSDDFSIDSMPTNDDFSEDSESSEMSLDNPLGEDFSTDSESMDLGSDTFNTDSMNLDDDFNTDLSSMNLDDDFNTDMSSMDLNDDFATTESMDLGEDAFSSDSLDLGEENSGGSIDFNEDFNLGTEEGFQTSEETMSFSDDFDTAGEESFSFDSAGDENIQYADHGEQSVEESSNAFVPPLYDKKLKEDIQKKRSRRKYSIPMIICVLCSIICIIAVILAFAFGAWPGGTPSVVNNVVTVEPPQVFEQERREEIQAGKEVPPPPTPEENTIEIVIEEEVVPVKPEPSPTVSGNSIRYLLVWGDTLWDLSDTYYRNPWLYETIADANNISNPDHIVAGTYISIPPR